MKVIMESTEFYSAGFVESALGAVGTPLIVLALVYLFAQAIRADVKGGMLDQTGDSCCTRAIAF